jgi:two-component system repressor protein LuxO
MADIFILDDDDLIRRALKRLLQSRGAEVEVFSTAEQALERLGERPQLLICDYHLPKFDGLEMAQRLKSASPSSKVLLLSGDLEDEAVTAALECGRVDRFLCKPWHQQDLLEAVESLLPSPGR